MTNEPGPRMGLMDEAAIIRYITESFDDVHVMESEGNRFFYCGPFDLKANPFPFTTLVTSDAYDQFSNLNRPGVFRLNVGVSKTSFQALFGPSTSESNEKASLDFTALDTLMPHPEYGKMYWLCVLNPSPTTFETVKSLLSEAYQMVADRRAKKRPVSES